MGKTNFYLLSLGCPRNLVDSEYIEASLIDAGYKKEEDPKKAHIIIVNSCSFIELAIDESIDELFMLARYKKEGICKKLILTGCLPERFQTEIIKDLPEVDIFIGTSFYDKFPEIIKSKKKIWFQDPNLAFLHNSKSKRNLSSAYVSYLKIAEGCNAKCSYCIIPKLRGKQRSREIEDIVFEAENLIKSGIKEIILVAQDTTNYGADLKDDSNIAKLLSRISNIDKNVWIRVLYGNPDTISDEFIEVIKNQNNISPYFDIPIQHASDRIIKKMNRKYIAKDLDILFDKIAKKIPNSIIRTSVMVGFPSETEEDFNLLLEFIKKRKFDLLGTFIYSNFSDIPSNHLKNHIDKKTANARFDKIMLLQKKISYDNNQKYLDKTIDVIIEKKTDSNVYEARSFFQAPDVDGIVFIETKKKLNIGFFYKAKIIDVLEYDLIGKIIK